MPTTNAMMLVRGQGSGVSSWANPQSRAAPVCCLILLASILAAAGQSGGEPSRQPTPLDWLARWVNAEVRALDTQRGQLAAQLPALPLPAGGNTSARLGWHSKVLPTAASNVWVRLDLGAVHPLDWVALVPASGEGAGQSGAGYGFPLRFRVEIAEEEDFSDATTIGDHTHADGANPGAFPFVIPAAGQRGRFLRITCSKPWPRRDDWIVALGEIIVLSGQRNLAAGATVQVSSAVTSPPAWAPDNLTDSQSLLGPPVGPEPSSSNGFLAQHERAPDAVKWVQVDLGREVDIEEVRLFPARPTDFADAPGTGFPVRFRIEAGNDPVFRTGTTVFATGARDFINPGDNALSFPCHSTRGRFVRVTAEQLHGRGTTFTFGLAEMQVWSGGTNVALKAPVTASDLFDNPQFPLWQPEYLVDGCNSRRRILDLPQWLAGLDRRRQLQFALVDLDSRREAAATKAMRRAMTAGGGIGVTFLLIASGLAWRSRLARRREVEQLRARIASDLHDEIGSQLGGIALAAQLAARRADDPEKAREHFAEIERTARETNDAMHDIVWLLKPGSVNLEELITRLRETASVQLREVECQFEAEGVTPRAVGIEFTRHVYLLGKEALANIAKHARARAVRIHVRVAGGTLHLTIHDDGTGYDPTTANSGNGLDNMRRRAAQLGGSLQITSAPGAGTTLTLTAPLR
jgi:signal transduction histidine kinase